MPLPQPAIPNFNVQTPDILGGQEKAATLSQMLSANALQKSLAPLQVQEAQQKVQAGDIDIQLKNIQLQGQRALSDWLQNGDANAEVPAEKFSSNDKIATYVGVSPNDPIMSVVRSMAQHHVPAPMLMAEAKGMLDRRTEYYKGTKEEQDAQKAERTVWQQSLAELNELPEDQRSAQLAAKLPLLQENSKTDPLLASYAQGLAGHPELIPQAYNTLSAENAALGLRKAKGEAIAAEQKVAPPSDTQVKTFTDKTIPSFASLRPEQKQAFVAEAKTARTVDELNKVIERADSTDKAEQMHKDSLAQTMALTNIHFADKGLEANDKTWSDPQHGYVTVASQIKVVKDALKAGADGNGLAASMAPIMTALGINSFNQMHRISPQEGQSAAMPGGYVERFNAWADKAFTGKLSPQVAKEGTELMDELLNAAHGRAVQASEMHAKGYGIPRQNMPAMDAEGNVTTLDKVKTKGAGATPETHTFSLAAWKAANPNGDAKAAEAAAKAQHYTVVP